LLRQPVRQSAADPGDDYFKLNEATLSFDRPHNFQRPSSLNSVGHGQAVPQRPIARVIAVWQVMALSARIPGYRSASPPLERPSIFQTSTQMADKVKSDVQILGGIGPAPRGSTRWRFRAVQSRDSATRLQHDARSRVRQSGLERCSVSSWCGPR